ncbi:hypothetical protein G6F47_013824 [Rhizopus delemar]|uniref:Uncharacterized protein n=1 Tax=Rhizopus delemar TaxID=936053 RepID=A0A9P6XR53_9FUNG|nr:hypothetical protein G6F52_013879 [Rhizopus delemar]KAG1530537.1 hypothetical protein G6F50_017250 [Rhizopus delemar]KAG1567833.1 hypothetical protein G6F47_013824 [Rhizopus delemar]
MRAMSVVDDASCKMDNLRLEENSRASCADLAGTSGTPSATIMAFATDSVPSSSSLGRMPFDKDQMEIDNEIDRLSKECKGR